MAKSVVNSRAKKLLCDYRHTAWRKATLEAVPGVALDALHDCTKRMRLTQTLVEALLSNKLVGEKLYWVIFITYLTERQPGGVDEILDRIAQNHEPIPRRTYFRLKKRAIGFLDNRLEEMSREGTVSVIN
jgi:hypothetical protein